MWLTLAALLVPSAGSAASVDVTAYRALVAQDLRLAGIGYRLATANAPFCRVQGYNPGWVIHDIAQYPDQEVARAAFGFEQPVEVAAIVQDSPADENGIKPGDGLVTIDDKELAEIPSGSQPSYQRVAEIKRVLEASWWQKYVARLVLQQAETRRSLLFRLSPVCASDFQVDPKSKLDAGANGEVVRVTSAMMDYVADDDELAAVVAHELAHNLLAHRTWLDAVKRSKTKAILATEIEADRLSVWLMANAGYDPKAALRFWGRYGKQYGLGIFTEGTHLRWKKRVAIMQGEIDLMTKTEKRDGLLPPPLLVAG